MEEGLVCAGLPDEVAHVRPTFGDDPPDRGRDPPLGEAGPAPDLDPLPRRLPGRAPPRAGRPPPPPPSASSSDCWVAKPVLFEFFHPFELPPGAVLCHPA